MSDSGNSFGEALEDMTTKSAKTIGGTIADFKNTAKAQVKGSGGISGSFTPNGPLTQGQQNPQPEAGKQNLSGGDLFSPDMLVGKPQSTGQGGQTMLTQAGQQWQQDPSSKSPEEAKKIQEIEQELRSLHKQYYQDFLAKAEGRDKKTQVEEQEKKQDDEEKKMQDLQKKEEKKQEDQTVFRAKRSSEIKGGLG